MNKSPNSSISTKQPPTRVLVVDDHRQARESMAHVLRHAGHEVVCCASAPEALNVLVHEDFDCAVTDLQMPGMSGLEFIIQLEQRKHPAQAVMVTAHATVTSAVEAMRHGAFDYIEKPFDADRLERLVDHAVCHGRLLRRESAGGNQPGEADSPAMIGSSECMQSLRQQILRIGPTPETVLITGESGTGKELVARAVHAASNRHDAPLVSLNCPVLSAHLMESELFGHERGAFTGADAPRAGRFEMADGGSILLDEVTEIDLNLQAKLLRVLQERSFERVGSNKTLRVDVRVLATTNRDLHGEVAADRFRADLYYRLAVVPLHVPSLRQRRDDIPELIDYFFKRSAKRLDQEPCTLEDSAKDLLVEYDWPGNVRELENLITRASVFGVDESISTDQLRRWLGDAPAGDAAFPPADVPVAEVPVAEVPVAEVPVAEVPVGLSLQEMERKLIEATLQQHGGHRAKTAEALGIGVRTLSDKLRRYGYRPREKAFAKAG